MSKRKAEEVAAAPQALEPPEELSSAEEEDHKRSRNRRRPRPLTHITQNEAPPVLPGAKHTAVPDADHPQLRTIAELKREHGYLDTQKAQSQMCEMAVNKLTSKQRTTSANVSVDIEALMAQLKPMKQEEAADVVPWADTMFQQKLAALPRAEYYFRSVTTRLSHNDLIKGLRQRQVELPLLRSDYEMGIMAEAGTFVVNAETGEKRTYPACFYGSECVTNKFSIPDPQGVGKFISMALVYPEEMEALRAQGVAAVSIRPCVLCCRKRLMDYVLWMREVSMSSESSQAMAAEGGTAAAVKNENGALAPVYQLFRNTMDCHGGYFRDYMLIPRADECIVDPICMFTCSPLKLLKLPNGRRCVDQRIMMWKPAQLIQARVGENVSNF